MVFNVTFDNISAQLYHGSKFYWWRKVEYPEKTTVISIKTVVQRKQNDNFIHICFW